MEVEPEAKAPAAAKPQKAAGAAAAPAAPAAPRRRRAGEDLIGELFEAMHDLHFVGDLMAGADFVLGIVQQLLPSEGALVHVFDINTRHFVVVRAFGPDVQKALLHRTPDKEQLFIDAMRRTRSMRFPDAATHPRMVERWGLLGIQPKSVLFGPVQLGGRYLGIVELANPQGGEPYHEGESNALDYICEQLAEFIAARPIVVDADVVLRKP